MSESTDCKAKPPIELLIQEIETGANKADDHVMAAALRLRELRQRVEGGELGENVKWMAWARASFQKISISRLYELSAIADARDPRAELERQREMTCEKVKKHREKKTALERAMEPERKELIAWAKTVPIDEVRLSLRGIRIRTNTGNIPPASRAVGVASLH